MPDCGRNETSPAVSRLGRREGTVKLGGPRLAEPVWSDIYLG